MTQNPYAQFGSPGSPQYGSDFIDPVSSRTSVLAIIGLVISIIGCIACVVPGPGAFAAIFGGLGLFFIARSSGRLTGTGIAITAIVLGLFQSIACIALWTGAAQVNQQAGKSFFVPVSNMMKSIDKGDLKGARTVFSTEANAVITDEMLLDFAKRYRAEAGTFQKTPENVLETIEMSIELAKSAKKSGSHQRPVIQPRGGDAQFPIPARFDKGLAFVLLTADVRHADHANGGPKMLNVCVITLDGTETWLVDPVELDKMLRASQSGSNTAAPGSTPSPIPSTPPTPPSAPAGGNP